MFGRRVGAHRKEAARSRAGVTLSCAALTAALTAVSLNVPPGPATANVPQPDKWLWEGVATSMASADASVRGEFGGMSGRGVGVALIDTGVTRVPGLDGAGQVVYGPDLSLDSQDPAKRHLDGYGHGTHLAGIIAGRGVTRSDEFRGMALNARVTSVKVGSSNGAVDVSQVIAGIDWVVAHRNDDPRNPIRVLNLSYGTDSVQPYQVDPLAHAVENAWRAGLVVVVAGGNDGNAVPLVNPATDPYVIAVGAADTANTAITTDDSVASFSNLGDARRSVDVVAPGRSLISLRVPGSYVDVNNASARVGTGYFRGSGSSQAAALTSGVVAQLLQFQSTLTPDQIKYLLTSTCHRLGTAYPANRGCMLDAMGAYLSAKNSAVPASTQTWPRSTGTGSIEAARGTAHLADGAAELTGENDLFGPFDSRSWAAASSARTAWSGGAWMGRQWTGSRWITDSTGTTSWEGRFWAGQSWTGRFWAGSTWSAITWKESAWS